MRGGKDHRTRMLSAVTPLVACFSMDW